MYFDKRLSAILRFTEDDLEANRHGYLNTGQARRKFWHYFSESWLSTVFSIPVFLFGGIATYAMTFAFGISLLSAFAPTAIEQTLRSFPERLLISVILGILWLFFVSIWIRFLIRVVFNLLDLHAGIVDYCVGKISIRREVGNMILRY